MPGGGIAFGPSPRSFAQKVNKKMMLTAIETILIDKIQSGNLLVTEGFELTGKTKEVASLLSDKNCSNSYIISKNDDSVLRAARNLPSVKTAAVKGFSVYEAVKFEKLIITQEALEALTKKVGEVMNLENIIIKPIVSEKASKLSEKQNVYCFKVNLKANKKPHNGSN